MRGKTMGDFGYIENIRVYINRDEHVLVQGTRPTRMGHDKFFDLHLCETITLSEASEREPLVEIDENEKKIAFRLYNQWKQWGKKDKIIEQAEAYLSLNYNRIRQEEQQNAQSSNDRITNQYPNTKQNPFDKELEQRQKKTSQAAIKQQNKPRVKETQKIEQALNPKEKAIKKIVEERKITSLFHFTHIQNLKSIMKRGLLSRTEVEELAKTELLQINDNKRLDKQREAICLSIGFPNYRMFYSYHQGNYDDWVVISLKPEILWKYDCAFCHRNAASNECKNIDINSRKRVEALKRLFDDINDVKREDLHLPKSFPTDPQAEVLVFDRIPVDDIKKIYFYNIEKLIYYKVLFDKHSKTLFDCERDYFKYRVDFKHWRVNQNNVDNEANFNEDVIPF